MVEKLKHPKIRVKEAPKEPTHIHTKQIRRTVKGALKKTKPEERREAAEEESDLNDCIRQSEEEETSGKPDEYPEVNPTVFPTMTELPPAEYSPERVQLTSVKGNNRLPKELRDIIGPYDSFFRAMDDNAAYEKVVKQLKMFEKTLPPELFREMVLILAETNSVVDSFLKDCKAEFWEHAMGNHVVFKNFVQSCWIKQAVEDGITSAELTALMICAAKANPQNAEWLKAKVERDEKGAEPQEESPYSLKEWTKAGFQKLKGALGVE